MTNPHNLTQAPSTRIRIFLNPQLFLSGFKSFHVHTSPLPVHTYPLTYPLEPMTALGILATEHASRLPS